MAGDKDIQDLNRTMKEVVSELKGIRKVLAAINDNYIAVNARPQDIIIKEGDGARGGSAGSSTDVGSAGQSKAESSHVSEGQGQGTEPREG